MIMISSTAGQRLAKAKAALDSEQPDGKDPMQVQQERREYMSAAQALADELIEDNHHLVEGD